MPEEPKESMGTKGKEFPEAFDFSGKKLADLWNYGLGLGYPNKKAMLAALDVKDDSQVGDLAAAAQTLYQMMKEQREGPAEDMPNG